MSPSARQEVPEINAKLSFHDKVFFDAEVARRHLTSEQLIRQIIHQWVVLLDCRTLYADPLLVLPPEASVITEKETLRDYLNRVEMIVVKAVLAKEHGVKPKAY